MLYANRIGFVAYNINFFKKNKTFFQKNMPFLYPNHPLGIYLFADQSLTLYVPLYLFRLQKIL